MPLHTSIPSIASGGGAIPITGGAATAGDAFSGGTRFAPVNIAGLFGTATSGARNSLLLPAVVVGVGIIAFILFRKKK